MLQTISQKLLNINIYMFHAVAHVSHDEGIENKEKFTKKKKNHKLEIVDIKIVKKEKVCGHTFDDG